jgi:hypothetical protein
MPNGAITFCDRDLHLPRLGVSTFVFLYRALQQNAGITEAGHVAIRSNTGNAAATSGSVDR